MSMSTIFVLFKDDEAVAVSPHLDPDESVRYFQSMYMTGTVVACRVSDGVAFSVRQMLEPGSRERAQAVHTLRSFSHHMQVCADVT